MRELAVSCRRGLRDQLDAVADIVSPDDENGDDEADEDGDQDDEQEDDDRD